MSHSKPTLVAKSLFVSALALSILTGGASADPNQPEVWSLDLLEQASFQVPRPAARMISRGDELYVMLGLDGVALVPNINHEDSHVYVVPEWPSLDASFLSDRHLLLAGRDSKIRLCHRDETDGIWSLAYAWEAEGIPTGIATHNDIVAVASGGAGVTIYKWRKDNDTAPDLVGRFPFAGYAKEIAFYDEKRIYATDAHHSGLWSIDISDPMLPHRTAFCAAHSYCDHLALLPDGHAWMSDRTFGSYLIAVSHEHQGAENCEREQTLAAITEGETFPHVQSIKADKDRTWIAEKFFGVRLLEPDQNTHLWRETIRYKSSREVLEVEPINEAKIAVSFTDGTIGIFDVK